MPPDPNDATSMDITPAASTQTSTPFTSSGPPSSLAPGASAYSSASSSGDEVEGDSEMSSSRRSWSDIGKAIYDAATSDLDATSLGRTVSSMFNDALPRGRRREGEEDEALFSYMIDGARRRARSSVLSREDSTSANRLSDGFSTGLQITTERDSRDRRRVIYAVDIQQLSKRELRFNDGSRTFAVSFVSRSDRSRGNRIVHTDASGTSNSYDITGADIDLTGENSATDTVASSFDHQPTTNSSNVATPLSRPDSTLPLSSLTPTPDPSTSARTPTATATSTTEATQSTPFRSSPTRRTARFAEDTRSPPPTDREELRRQRQERIAQAEEAARKRARRNAQEAWSSDDATATSPSELATSDSTSLPPSSDMSLVPHRPTLTQTDFDSSAHDVHSILQGGGRIAPNDGRREELSRWKSMDGAITRPEHLAVREGLYSSFVPEVESMCVTAAGETASASGIPTSELSDDDLFRLTSMAVDSFQQIYAYKRDRMPAGTSMSEQDVQAIRGRVLSATDHQIRAWLQDQSSDPDRLWDWSVDDPALASSRSKVAARYKGKLGTVHPQAIITEDQLDSWASCDGTLSEEEAAARKDQAAHYAKAVMALEPTTYTDDPENERLSEESQQSTADSRRLGAALADRHAVISAHPTLSKIDPDDLSKTQRTWATKQLSSIIADRRVVYEPGPEEQRNIYGYSLNDPWYFDSELKPDSKVPAWQKDPESIYTLNGFLPSESAEASSRRETVTSLASQISSNYNPPKDGSALPPETFAGVAAARRDLAIARQSTSEDGGMTETEAEETYGSELDKTLTDFGWKPKRTLLGGSKAGKWKWPHG